MPESSDYHIYVTSSLTDEQLRVLKNNDLFAVFNTVGDIRAAGRKRAHGLYLNDTRFVNRLELRIADLHPLLLSSTVKEDNAVFNVDLTNPDISLNGQAVQSDTLHIMRSKFLRHHCYYEEIRVRNFGVIPVEIPLSIHLDSDFFDIFELRGMSRHKRGRKLPVIVHDDGVVHRYIGLDQIERQLVVQLTPVPEAIDEDAFRYHLCLQPGEQTTLTLCIECSQHDSAASPIYTPGSSLKASQFNTELNTLAQEQHNTQLKHCDINTSNDLFNRWVARSAADLYMLTTHTPYGPYPYAGTPWYSTVFGRDGLITAYQCLWAYPELARGVLTYLANYQATQTLPAQDAEPGKILHELRKSEMAILGEVPFRCYYGSVDSTLLFIILAGAYYERTADDAFLEHIWPAVDMAMQWIEFYGDRDGDGYVEYGKHATNGLDQQGWKDSHDSVFHSDGTIATSPIALCEVQGYLYAARRAIDLLARALNLTDLAEEQLDKAERLRVQFERDFWSEELGMYAIALDGSKNRCEVRSSNAGQCLFSGIVSQPRAEQLSQQLMGDAFYSGWGIRTIASTEARYNPMAYHNGSIWPHDNAMIALGMGRYGFQEYTTKILRDFFVASRFFDLHRLPELFCGFTRRPGEGPTLYPVACSPQAWASGAIYMMLQSVLGLKINALQGQIIFHQPCLPQSLNEVVLRNLRLAGGSVDIRVRRHAQDVGVEVIRRNGNIKILVVK